MNKFIVVLLTVIFGACSTSAPKPTSSDFAKINFGGFTLLRNEGVHYQMNYTILGKGKEATNYEISFESTIPNQSNQIITGAIDHSTPELKISSQTFACATNNKIYTVKLSLFKGSQRLTEINQKIQLAMPNSILDEFGIKAC